MDELSKRAALQSAIALLVFTALTTFALVGWFFRADIAVTWKSVLTLGSVLLGGTTSMLMWRSPSRVHAYLGIGVMISSLARIGLPGDWTWVSFALVAITFVLLMPVVHAAIVLRDG